MTVLILYHLECKEGFYGEDGFTCKDIDECACAEDNCPEVNKVFLIDHLGTKIRMYVSVGHSVHYGCGGRFGRFSDEGRHFRILYGG